MEDFVPYKKWQHQHDGEIRQEFPDRPTETLAREMQLNYYTVSRRATRMGVGKTDAFMRSSWKKGSSRKGGWKKDEVRKRRIKAADRYMLEHFADTRNEDIARHFRVDVKTVRRWARRLGLVKSVAFMQASRQKGCCGNNRYYTDRHQAWRRQRIADVYPDGDDEALKVLAEELGVTVGGLRGLAYKFGIHRSDERRREAALGRAAKLTKYGPEVIAALKEYYPDHTTEECAEHFGVSPGVINQLAVRYKVRKSREHIHKVRSNVKKRLSKEE